MWISILLALQIYPLISSRASPQTSPHPHHHLPIYSVCNQENTLALSESGTKKSAIKILWTCFCDSDVAILFFLPTAKNRTHSSSCSVWRRARRAQWRGWSCIEAERCKSFVLCQWKQRWMHIRLCRRTPFSLPGRPSDRVRHWFNESRRFKSLTSTHTETMDGVMNIWKS